MNKYDYLKFCFEQRAYQKKIWLLAAFSVVTDNPGNKARLNSAKYCVYRDDNGFYFINDESREIRVEGDLSKPLFYKHEKLTIDGSWHPSIKEPIVTTIGILLLNRVVLWEAFQDRVKYYNQLITGKLIKSIINDLMVDNPRSGETIAPGKASVTECHKVTKQANYLEGLNEIFAKAGSLQAVSVSPKVIALRDKLFKEHADELNDPIVAANIIKAVVDADAEDQLNGDSADFFIDMKFIDNARKKMFLVFGLERDFSTGEYRLIKQPLNEGWDLKQITHYINTAVAASYDRGKATGLGGAGVKDLMRLTSRITVTEEDCGSTVTEKIFIDGYSLKNWKGGYYLVDGKPVMLKGDEKNLIGKTVDMRVPQYCLTKEGNLCKTCVGESLGKSANRISSEVVNIATVFMLIKMKNAHVSKVATTKIPIEELFE